MPEPATIYKLAQEYLADLRKGEAQAVRLLERRYASIWRTIAKESAAILKMSDDASALPTWRKGQLDRYNSLMAQVRDELTALGNEASDEVAALQREAVQLGFDLSKRQFEAMGVTASFDMLPAAATQQMVGFLSDGTPLNALLQTLGEVSAQRVGSTLSQAIALGWGPRKTAEKLRRETGLSLTRAMRIARTEQLRAFRASTIEGYRQSGIVTGYRRMSARNANTCIACLLKDGEIYALASDFHDHPNGRCTIVPIINEDYGVNVEWESGRTWFGKQDEATQRKILGGGVHDAWKKKEIALEDMAHLRQDSTWGDSWQAASLQRAKTQAQARRAG